MATNYLTASKIAKLESGKHHDGDGLYLDRRSPTSASWLFKFTWGGKADEVGLGSLKKVDLERARELRAWCLAELGAARNPKRTLQAEKLERVREANAPPPATVYELAKNNIRLIAKTAKSAAGQKAWVRSMHRDFIGYIADMNPADVTRGDVKPIIEAYFTGKDAAGRPIRTPAPTMGRVLQQRLCKLLSWARATDRITAPDWVNPAAWSGNLEHTLDATEHQTTHHASLAAADVGAFLEKARQREANAVAVRRALEWHIISATRPTESAGADWSEIDWANDCWVIPAERMKMRRLHRAPLTARHHAILDALLGGAEFPPTSGPLFSINSKSAVTRQAMDDLMKAVQPSHCTLHGFRGTFSTWARNEAYEVQLPTGDRALVRLYDEAMIEEALSHVVGDATRNAYIRDDFLDRRRAMMEAWAVYATTVRDTNVTPFRRRRAA